MKFAKNDSNKISRPELIDPDFTLGVGAVLRFGAEKYDDDNWKLGTDPKDIRRIYGAIQRHLLAHQSGEIIDKETGLNHMLHVATNAMFLYYHTKGINNELRGSESKNK